MTFNKGGPHDPDCDPRVYSASQQHVEFRKDGAVSKMRSHKGNIPVLPQTKLCPQCPAKFTRTTHLNRHLRTHSNERMHCCDTCNSQFTRSDLLTRHKRSCSDTNVNRTRRKSCLACADSKIKCDLQYPCAKCKTRGKECVFITGSSLRGTSRNSTPDIVPSESSGHKDSMLNWLVPGTSSGYSSSGPSNDSDKMITSVPESLPTTARAPSTFGLPPDPAPAFSADMSGMGTLGDFCPSIPAELEAIPNSHLNQMYPNNDVFEPLFSQIFADSLFDLTTSNEEFLRPPSSHVSGDESCHGFSLGNHSIPPRPEGPGLASLWDPSIFVPSVPTAPASTTSFRIHSSDLVLLPSEEPTAEDLERYLYMFFSAFLIQLPIIHVPTWRPERIPPVLLGAMRACGALYIKTKTADEFIVRTMASTREVLVQEFGENRTDSGDPFHLILALVLLQTVGLFHQKSNERAYSNIYHGMLVMMIQRAGLISRNSAWAPSNPAEAPLEIVWQDWARHEMTKRVLLLSYLQDCYHCIYFALPPSYHPSEIVLSLPCEEMLWTSDSPSRWFMALQQSSPYGSPYSRLVGVHMPKALSLLMGTRVSSTPVPLNPFSHLVLIHSILRHFFIVCIETRRGGSSMSSSSQSNMARGIDRTVQSDVVGLQHALHNWLQSWLNSPSLPNTVPSHRELPFIQNAIPLYWFGQVSLLTSQEGLPPFDIRSMNMNDNMKAEERFRLVKTWLGHIRGIVRMGDNAPTLFWDELMKIRFQTVNHGQPFGGGYDNQEGLLWFFSKP